MRLRVATSPQWVQVVLKDLDRFLIDHAACERKASATAMSLVAHYRDRDELVRAMIGLAREELEHFEQVYERLAARGLTLGPDEKDAYVRRLGKLVRPEADVYLLDRLLVAGVIEARGCERFGIVAQALPAGELKDFYEEITRSEARHHALFVRVASVYYPREQIRERLDALLDAEAEILLGLPHRPAVH